MSVTPSSAVAVTSVKSVLKWMVKGFCEVETGAAALAPVEGVPTIAGARKAPQK